MGAVKLDDQRFYSLPKLDITPGDIIYSDGCWHVRRALNKETNTSVSVKYYQAIGGDYLGLMMQMLAREIHLLQAIQRIESPSLIKFLGARRDTKPEGTLKVVLMLECMEDSLENLRRVGFHPTQNELLYILDDLVDQLVLLQQNGIACRDIKPTNIAVIKSTYNTYQFKICDFSTGCIVEGRDNYLMRVHGVAMGCTEYFASPETLIITQLTRVYHERYHQDFYDPFLSDVYSLAKCVERLMDGQKGYGELNEVLSLMLMENLEARIDFFQLQEMLKTPRFQKLMKQPSGLESYIGRSHDIWSLRSTRPDLMQMKGMEMGKRPDCPTQ